MRRNQTMRGTLLIGMLALTLVLAAVPARAATIAKPAWTTKLPAAAPSHRVCLITLNPLSPNILPINQNVTISFTYATTETAGVRIFARPFTAGSLSPGYAASGSSLYPVGSGTGSGSFTITSGDATVDQIRFQMLTADQSRVLFEGFIPVHYQFKAAANVVRQIALSPPNPNILANGDDITISFTYATTETGGVRIFARPFAGGALAPNYAASGSSLYPTGSGSGSGSFTIASGDVTVDRIRFQMLSADQSRVLFEGFIPVHYQFGLGQRTIHLPIAAR